MRGENTALCALIDTGIPKYAAIRKRAVLYRIQPTTNTIKSEKSSHVHLFSCIHVQVQITLFSETIYDFSLFNFCRRLCTLRLKIMCKLHRLKDNILYFFSLRKVFMNYIIRPKCHKILYKVTHLFCISTYEVFDYSNVTLLGQNFNKFYLMFDQPFMH